MIYITGDTHGQFARIEKFCERHGTTKDDVMIILGDACINYNGNLNDVRRKEYVSRIPITFFCVHGNHERRPHTVPSYTLSDWHGGKVWMEYDFPKILFAKDGEVYDIDGKQTIVIGGAYSVDKHYRLEMGYKWFPDEQPNDEIKAYVEKQLAARDWKVDAVLSHTAPLRYEPRDKFIPGLDQSRVDKTTETWIAEIEEKLDYQQWYAGHYHTDRKVDNFRLMYEDIDMFGSYLQ